jgi:hypothetical protein
LIPFRIKFVPVPGTSDTASRRNGVLAALFPRAERGEHVHPVAVCGGGPSLNEHLQELKDWPGDVWAVNATADYLLERGIDCTMITVDGMVKTTGAKKRLLATNCDPALFHEDVRCFALLEFEEGGVPGSSTTASRAPALALRLGYPGVVFFGCDSSFEDRTHVDRHEEQEEALYVRANGRDWLTHPEMVMQAEALSALLREFPDRFQSKSGGLLDAMTADSEWSVVAVSDAYKRNLIEQNGDIGLYDAPYKAPCRECGQSEGHYDDCPVGLGVSE